MPYGRYVSKSQITKHVGRKKNELNAYILWEVTSLDDCYGTGGWVEEATMITPPIDKAKYI